MNFTAYAKRTQYKPIDFYFRGVCDVNTKKVVLIDAFQILNDRFLGRMSVCNYFFIAENSVRINELNIIALEELKKYHLVMRENFYIPEKIVYALPITTRFLDNDRDFEILLSTLKDNDYKKGSIVLTFYCNTLARIDEEGKKRYDKLRKAGFKTCVSGFGDEFNELSLFADFNFDYLRCEAQYFDAKPNKKRVFEMLVKYCKINKICLIVEGVDTPAQYARYKKEGVVYVTGKAVSKLSRWITNEFLGLPELNEDEKAIYSKKLQKVLDSVALAEQAELEALRQVAIEKAKNEDGIKIMPRAPRPELAKSPYQIRLEQQKQIAKKVAIDRAIVQQAKTEAKTQEYVKSTKEERQEKRLIEQMSPMSFEGDVKSMLALDAVASERKVDLGLNKQIGRAHV